MFLFFLFKEELTDFNTSILSENRNDFYCIYNKGILGYNGKRNGNFEKIIVCSIIHAVAKNVKDFN